MKIKQTYTEKEFEKLTKIEIYNLWFKDALTDGQIARLYGVSKQQVKQKRKQFNLKYLNCAILSLVGRPEYRNKMGR